MAGQMAGTHKMAEGWVGIDLASHEAVAGMDRVGRFVGGLGQFAGIAAGGAGMTRSAFGASAFTNLRGSAAVSRVSSSLNSAAGRVWSRVDDAAGVGKNAGVGGGGDFTGRFARMDPTELRFSQNTAGGNGRAAAVRASMSKQGWNGPAVDAVETADGIVTLDNTRPAVARELGIPSVPVKIRLPSDPLPPSSLGRFGDASTWGEALQYRTSSQRPPLPATGTPNSPRLPR